LVDAPSYLFILEKTHRRLAATQTNMVDHSSGSNSSTAIFYKLNQN
jgi:hypothetical protein